MAKRSKKKSSGRARAQDLPNMTGPGVGIPKHKDLDKLGDKFIAIRDQKSELAEEMTAIQSKIVDKMNEKELSEYRFGDQKIVIKNGKVSVKVVTVRVDSADASTAEERDTELPPTGEGEGETQSKQE